MVIGLHHLWRILDIEIKSCILNHRRRKLWELPSEISLRAIQFLCRRLIQAITPAVAVQCLLSLLSKLLKISQIPALVN